VGLFGHDLVQVAKDLDSILEQLAPNSDLLLVSNSIGGPLSRIYASTYPSRVAGLIMLASNPAHCRFQNDIFPDPNASDFDPESLPSGLTVDELIAATEIMYKMFSPSNPNKEGLDRRNLAQLLPSASEPKLTGPGARAPYITVVGHDAETFAQEGLERMKISKVVTQAYLQPYWEEYDQGLLEIGNREVGNKVKIAKGCGHVIQLGNPQYVAEELRAMLQKLGW
jgi:pimeloyl-ACP methyl ester carboxylesterase